jgi:hypothetical protein
MGSIKPQENKYKESESSIDSAAHNQIFKHQKQLNGRKHNIPINISTECPWIQLPYQKTPFGKLD